MSTSASSARWLRGTLVGACSSVLTAAAHAAASGGLPQGGALMVAVLVCGAAGATIGSASLEGRRTRVLGVVVALGLAQILGHLTIVASSGHHHMDAGLGLSSTMLAAHAAAAIVLGIAITAVEYLYLVCASVLSWLRLFAAAAPRPATRLARWATSVVVAQSVLLLSGLGMRAPPQGIAAAA